MRTVLALHAHPDDESSKGAATMGRLADAGFRCVLVCATGGEAGDVLNPAMDLPGVAENIAEYRRKELAVAASIIGYGEIVHLGYRDSGMPGSEHNAHPLAFVNAATNAALETVVEVVRRVRPEVVFGYADNKRYPHPDHLKVHELTVALTAAAADPSRYAGAGPPWKIPLVVAPKVTVRRTRALHDEMVRRGLESPLAGRLNERSRADDTDVTVRVNVAGYVERARNALAAHATQIDPGGHWFAVPLDVVESAYPFEDFLVLDGSPSVGWMADLFESW
jgi:mycothiol S-conjugate amidase